MLVTVFTSDEQAIAHLVAGHLQNRGVQAYVNDENLVMVDNLYGPAVAGVKVQVLPEAVDRARQVITEELTDFVQRGPLPAGVEPDTSDAPAAAGRTVEQPDAKDFELARCASCCSTDLIAYRPWAWLALLFPPLFVLGSMKRYRCMACGNVQKMEEDE